MKGGVSGCAKARVFGEQRRPRAVMIEAQARTLLAHEASGYEDWGASGAIRVTPDASGRGLTLSIAPV